MYIKEVNMYDYDHIVTLLATNISLTKALLKMMSCFTRWDMFVHLEDTFWVTVSSSELSPFENDVQLLVQKSHIPISRDR